MYNSVKTDKEMVEYLVDCTLATVESMIGLRSTPKAGEFKRQCDIAQKGVDFLGADYPFKSRAKAFAGVETAYAWYSRKHREQLEADGAR